VGTMAQEIAASDRARSPDRGHASIRRPLGGSGGPQGLTVRPERDGDLDGDLGGDLGHASIGCPRCGLGQSGARGGSCGHASTGCSQHAGTRANIVSANIVVMHRLGAPAGAVRAEIGDHGDVGRCRPRIDLMPVVAIKASPADRIVATGSWPCIGRVRPTWPGPDRGHASI
jgi:hypothetical protein